VARKTNAITVLAQHPELWSPRIVGEVNDYDVKVSNVAGDYVTHTHEDTDEIFIVLSGRLQLLLEGETIVLEPMDIYTVPAGVEHLPRAEEGTRVMFIEPRGTTQDGTPTGSTGSRN
jgi:mannose-6-phosphate isomerase-like protein (cupin superfamily)